jgi:hypothetical protein
MQGISWLAMGLLTLYGTPYLDLEPVINTWKHEWNHIYKYLMLKEKELEIVKVAGTYNYH